MIKKAFLEIKPIYLAISLSLTLPAVLIRNYAWQLILKEQKIKISFFRSLKIFFIGYFYGSFTPGFIGQIVRVPYLKQETGEPYGKLFVNTLIDSTLRSIAQYLLIILGAILVIQLYPNMFWIDIIILALTILAFFYFIKKERGEKIFYLIIKYLIPKKLKTDFYRFVNTFYYDFPRINRLVIPLFLGLITLIIGFSQEYIIVMSLGLDIPYHYFILLFPFANIAGYLPITFAGLGIRELTSMLIFSTLFAVPQEKIFVATIVGFIITNVFTGFIGFLVSLTETRDKKVIAASR